MTSEDSLSSILGWISIACWVVVYTPQVYTNYTLKSGEGLSIITVIIWLLGDIGNLVGALLAGLLPTIIILAFYYITCNSILLCQIYYYRHYRTVGTGDFEERTPLLGAEGSSPKEVVPAKIVVLRYASSLTFVFSVGVAAWWITKDGEDERNFGDPAERGRTWWLIQFLGWSSATLFLGARVPQILKNFKTRCEGLSPAVFFFAIFGNTTYVLSICAKSMDRAYLITNGGWLAGSLLTVFLDIFVLCQFSYYRHMDESPVG